MWIPPGRWIDYFTGATFTGPVTTTVSVPLNRMPVFVRAGGIIPEQASSTTSPVASSKALVLDVFPGSSGRFDLYSDSGTGLGYTRGQDGRTSITDGVGPVEATGAALRVHIGATAGRFPGQSRTLAYRLEMVDLSVPSQVTVNGRPLADQTAGSNAPGWYYQPTTATVVVDTPVTPITRATTVVVSGSRTLDRSEPPPPVILSPTGKG